MKDQFERLQCQIALKPSSRVKGHQQLDQAVPEGCRQRRNEGGLVSNTCLSVKQAFRWGIWLGLFIIATLSLPAATLSDSAVDGYNVRVGTQTFSGRYQFTTNTLLVESARAIQEMGSDVIKFYLGSSLFQVQNGGVLPPNITNLLTEVRDEPSCRQVLDMPFHHFILWAYPFGNAWPFDGYSASERAGDYREIYDLTRYFLTNYNNSGKSFYLGHWEGDWYLLPNYNTATNPSPVAIQGMRDWLNNRQQAVDDAKRDTGHTNVNVFNYAEVNRVRDAMSGNTNINQRAINQVIPYVTNLDCLSWSSYDGMDLDSSNLIHTLDYMQSQLPTNKAGLVTGPRIWVGEYGWGGTLSTAAQEPMNRAYIQKLLPWGPRFILFWEMYDNETNSDGSYKNYCLINSNNVKVESWYLHQRFINRARLLTAQFQETYGRLPTDAEFAGLTTPLLNQALPAPVNLTIATGGLTSLASTAATITGQLAQGVYGDDGASVGVFWGGQDGGGGRNAWEHFLPLGTNTRFNPTTFTAQLNNLTPGDGYFFRFYATNASGEAWSPASVRFTTPSPLTNGSFEAQPTGTTKSIGSSYGGTVDPTTFTGWRAFSVGSPSVANFTATIITNHTDGNLAMRLSLTNTGGGGTLDHGLDNDNAKVTVTAGAHYDISFDAAFISGSPNLTFSVAEFDANNGYTGNVTVTNFVVADPNYRKFALRRWTPLANTAAQALLAFRQQNSGATTYSVMSFDHVQFADSASQVTAINVAGTTATMGFAGNPGRVYVLQCSTNLVNWGSLATNTAPAGGLFSVTNDVSGQTPVPPNLFYRLWQP